MRRSRKKTDVIIIGAGVAGTAVANSLRHRGFRVTLLEHGATYINREADLVKNEASMFKLVWDNGDYEISGDGFTGAPNLGRGVGGGSLAWTGVSFRLFERDFRFKSNYGRPDGTNVEDWPIGLADLEKYYKKAERDLGVSGTRTPWDPRNKPPLPNPPFGYYCSGLILEKGMQSLGIQSAPGPVAVNSRVFAHREECDHCGFCRSGCLSDAKYQADYALLGGHSRNGGHGRNRNGALDLRTEVVVQKIHTEDEGTRASGVTYYDINSGTTHRVDADVIVACNNPLEIPRLFLNSADEYHPNGLGNRYDQVGRNFFCHLATIGAGITDDFVNASHGYNMGNIITLDFTESRSPGQYVGGFSFQSLNGAGAVVLAVDPLRHLWGKKLKDAMMNYNNALFCICFCEGMPVYDNRITVNPDAKDKFGMPVARIHYELHENDHKVFADALEQMDKILKASGAHTVYPTSTSFEAHPMGSMRMGNDEKTSVTDSYGKVHGLENVFIGGSALFVTGSSVNPTLTIHALALRTANYIKKKWRG